MAYFSITISKTEVVARPSFEDEKENNENIDNTKPNLPDFVCVELNQLKLLSRHCYICGNRIFDDNVKYSTKGGILFMKYWCGSCSSYRYWKSYEYSLSVIAIGAANLASIGFAKLLNFFQFLSCSFPKRSSLFAAAKNIVYPVITRAYEDDREQILAELRTTNTPINICIDGQYDSPVFCAYYIYILLYLLCYTFCIVQLVQWKLLRANLLDFQQFVMKMIL